MTSIKSQKVLVNVSELDLNVLIADLGVLLPGLQYSTILLSNIAFHWFE